jgi:hypothetical protein
MLVECGWCKKEFDRCPASIKEKNFCSRKCYGEATREKHSIRRICRFCNEEFKVPRYYAKDLTTCFKEECRKKNKQFIVDSMHKGNFKGRKAGCHPDRPHEAFGLCKACYSQQLEHRSLEKRRKQHAEWRKNNPRKVQAAHRRYIYGVDESYIQERLTVQAGLCAICRQAPATDLDHNHITDSPRGMLCGGCNRGIGLLKDDIGIVQRAVEYLKMWEKETKAYA